MVRPAKKRCRINRERWYYVHSEDVDTDRVRVRGRRVNCSDIYFCFLWRGRKFSGSWYVSEMQTGVTVAREETSERAMLAARSVLDDPGTSPLRDRIHKLKQISPPKDHGRYRMYTQANVDVKKL